MKYTHLSCVLFFSMITGIAACEKGVLRTGNQDGGASDGKTASDTHVSHADSSDGTIGKDSNTTNDTDNTDSSTNTAQGWLYTKGNQIYLSNGNVWRARGANIHDTRSCNACTWGPPNVAEVKRRIDELVDGWGANFMRLVLESYGSADGRFHWKPATEDSDYLNDIKEIVAHIATKPGVYVLLSFWQDPTFTDLGWPSAKTADAWKLFAETFIDDNHVIFGLCNEPKENWDGSQDGAVWQAMNNAVQAIRDVEAKHGSARHLIAVQGTRNWARNLEYYVTHPITAGGGTNIVYETHPYNPTQDFDDLFVKPSNTLPVIIGEFGPFQGNEQKDWINLMDIAEQRNIPYAAWTFHMRCPPNLFNDPGVACGEGMSLVPTDWGQLIKDRFNQPWKL